MRPEELDAIEARAEAATPGPWSVETEHDGDGEPFGKHWTYVRGVSSPSGDDWVWVVRFDDDYGTDQTSDARFIAHARTDVPALLAEVKRLRAQVRT